MFIVCLANVSCFLIDPSDLTTRMMQAGLMLLTVVAYQSVVSEMLPNMSYLTILDVYILSAIGFLCYSFFKVCDDYYKVTFLSDHLIPVNNGTKGPNWTLV